MTDLTLLLTILSVLAGVALLSTLVLGLLFIFKPLQNVRRTLRQIAMGVRAIETETAPLGARAVTLRESLERTAGQAEASAAALSAAGTPTSTPTSSGAAGGSGEAPQPRGGT